MPKPAYPELIYLVSLYRDARYFCNLQRMLEIIALNSHNHPIVVIERYRRVLDTNAYQTTQPTQFKQQLKVCLQLLEPTASGEFIDVGAAISSAETVWTQADEDKILADYARIYHQSSGNMEIAQNLWEDLHAPQSNQFQQN